MGKKINLNEKIEKKTYVLRRYIKLSPGLALFTSPGLFYLLA
jgi:hypothetical protein